MNSPDCLPLHLSISVFLVFSVSVFHFLVVGFRAGGRLSGLMSAFERTLK